MVAFRDFVKVVCVFALLGGASSVAAQDVAEAVNPNAVVETFEGDDRSLMLGGQISFDTKKSPWLVYIADGKLVLENRTAPQSLHYNDIAWIKYPASTALKSTENSVISAIVESESNGNGGAGILFGSGKKGVYLMFSVDEDGRYHIFRKDGRTTRPVHSAKHEAIVVNGANELAFRISGANVVFSANGAEIIEIPIKISGARQLNTQLGVGLAAFGTGTYYFDSVEISEAN